MIRSKIRQISKNSGKLWSPGVARTGGPGDHQSKGGASHVSEITFLVMHVMESNGLSICLSARGPTSAETPGFMGLDRRITRDESCIEMPETEQLHPM